MLSKSTPGAYFLKQRMDTPLNLTKIAPPTYDKYSNARISHNPTGEVASFKFPRLRKETLGLSSQPAQKEESET